MALPATKRLKNKSTAILLAAFLGGLGAHRFYLGQWVWGILYVVSSPTLIPFALGLIEAVIYACTSKARWDEKYNDGVASDPISKTRQVVNGAIAVGIGFLLLAVPTVFILAYDDFDKRAGVALAINQAGSHKAEVLELLAAGETKPSLKSGPGDTAGFLKAVYFDTDQKVLVGVLREPLEDKTFGLKLVPATKEWSCGTRDLQMKYLPAFCRNEMRYSNRLLSEPVR